MISLTKEYIRSKMVRRDRNAHKGVFGRVLIYAGSVGMSGAAVLCGRSALKGGAGLVRFLIPSYESPLYTILQISVPEATCLEYRPGFDFSEYDAIAAGPGLGNDPAAYSILKDILENYDKNLVLDADALNMVCSSQELTALVRSSRARKIMTPHVGEARRLLSNAALKPSPDILWSSDDGRILALKTISDSYYSIVVLKGSGTLVGTGENICRNTTGNPGMATGGSGDVLTGLIAALCGQGYSPIDSAAIGVFAHGLAGDIAAEELGEMGMISSDIAAVLPKALKEIY